MNKNRYHGHRVISSGIKRRLSTFGNSTSFLLTRHRFARATPLVEQQNKKVRTSLHYLAIIESYSDARHPVREHPRESRLSNYPCRKVSETGAECGGTKNGKRFGGGIKGMRLIALIAGFQGSSEMDTDFSECAATLPAIVSWRNSMYPCTLGLTYSELRKIGVSGHTPLFLWAVRIKLETLWRFSRPWAGPLYGTGSLLSETESVHDQTTGERATQI
ncbi:hypothetical protein JTE90_020015 [Oedothorax gibbosus]|uniref:Uncharacterized protein n=1 Tax=Oedothorax gibbosus TaxID=931172 RepID=A0AAV6UL11_9ARAC|nr:hypothetical protein JTE90_020015 [Oedothorax gibbosus]